VQTTVTAPKQLLGRLPIHARCTLASPDPQLTHDREQHAARQFRREEEPGLERLELALGLALLVLQDEDALPGGVELDLDLGLILEGRVLSAVA